MTKIMESVFTIIHVTDTHFGSGVSLMESFVEIINQERLCPLPDLIVHTGDIINGYNPTIETHRAQMYAAKTILDRLRAPLLAACHNHDTYGEEIRGTVFDHVFAAPHVQEVTWNDVHLLLFSGALHSSDVYGRIPDEGPSEWGFDICTEAGIELLRERLRTGRGRIKLVFSHAGLVSPRTDPRPADPSQSLPALSGGYGYCMPEPRARSIRRLLAEEGVLAHYCGHSHINARHRIDGVTYVSTASLINFPGEARLLEIRSDRVEHRMLSLPGGRDLPMRWSSNLADAEHATPETYFAGNPDERNFTL